MIFENWIKDDTKNVLLVEPNFPIPAKSRNHSNFLPIGLLHLTKRKPDELAPDRFF